MWRNDDASSQRLAARNSKNTELAIFQDLGAVCSIPVLCSSLKVTFKKTKRRVKKIRKKEKEVIMRADDLLPLGDQTQDGDFGSRLAWTQ